MPLSDHEQRMLDQIESALYAEDPQVRVECARREPAGTVCASASAGRRGVHRGSGAPDLWGSRSEPLRSAGSPPC